MVKFLVWPVALFEIVTVALGTTAPEGNVRAQGGTISRSPATSLFQPCCCSQNVIMNWVYVCETDLAAASDGDPIGNLAESFRTERTRFVALKSGRAVFTRSTGAR